MPIMRNKKRLIAAVMGGRWTPAKISSLLWWESDFSVWQDSARTTLASADADVVGALEDRSGNGNYPVMTVADNKPTLQTEVGDLINGHRVVRFDGANDYLRVALGLTGNPAFSVAVVVKRSRDQTESFWGLGDTAANAGIGGGWNTAGTDRFNVFQYSSVQSYVASTSTDPVIHISSHTTAPTLDLWINGAAGIDSGAPAALNIVLDQFDIGNFDVAIPAAIDLAAIIVKSGVFTAAEINHLNSYWGAKYGITTSPL